MIMDVPYAGNKTSVVIYNALDKVNSKCSHAFIIVHGKESVVQSYRCQ